MSPPYALVGVLGHVDHGKTALVRALTGKDTDRLAEEKRRGISIVLGFARLTCGDGTELDLVDVPGHERFVRAMVAGATAMRAALLTVDAGEGVRPQTVEHAEVAALLGVRQGVVAVTRCDRAEASPRRAAEEARGLLRGLGLGDWPTVPTSAVTGAGLGELRAALAGLAAAASVPEPGCAWLPVDRVFALPGVGTVATGALRRGGLALGDEVELLPSGRRARVRSLQLHGEQVVRAMPGRRTAVALRGVGHADLAPGDMLSSPGLLALSHRVDARVEVLASAPRDLEDGQQLVLLAGTTERLARLNLLGRPRLEPGTSDVAQLRLKEPLALPAREPFVLRLASPPRTVGGGVVLDPCPPRRRARDAPLLRRLADATPLQAMAMRLADAGHHGCGLATLARLGGLPPGTLLGRLAEAEGVALPTGVALHQNVATRLETAVLSAIEAHQRRDPTSPGLPVEELRAELPAGAPVDGILARLAAGGGLKLAGGRLRREGSAPSVALLSAADRALLVAVERAFRTGGLCPPDVREVVAGDRRRLQALHFLLRLGVLVRAPDAVQKREILFHRDALATARHVLLAHFGGRADGFLAGECSRLLGISRRYSIPLLERLDTERFTRRDGDRRHLTVVEPEARRAG